MREEKGLNNKINLNQYSENYQKYNNNNYIKQQSKLKMNYYNKRYY